MAFANNQGTRIYWDEQGRGEPVLLVMGLGWASNMWHRTRPALARRFRTIAFDNRGAGRSDVPTGPYAMATMACDAAAVLDAAGVESAHLVGASMGGMISQEFALQYPKRARSLVLACTTPGGPHAVQAEPSALQMLFQRTGGPRERAEAAVPFIYDASTPRERIDDDLKVLSEWYPIPEGYMSQLQGILAWEAYSRLPQVSVPTLIIHGENDGLVPAGNADVIAERIPDSRLVKIPHASHIFMTDQPEQALQAILEFLGARVQEGVNASKGQ
ncbi:MAG TPA: alpha/beta hydrolase [Candidatus Methylomirabilis sp.]|nr:alpha/beta hydrolase [Candidatus Methylomirabilis sp.]